MDVSYHCHVAAIDDDFRRAEKADLAHLHAVFAVADDHLPAEPVCVPAVDQHPGRGRALAQDDVRVDADRKIQGSSQLAQERHRSLQSAASFGRYAYMRTVAASYQWNLALLATISRKEYGVGGL